MSMAGASVIWEEAMGDIPQHRVRLHPMPQFQNESFRVQGFCVCALSAPALWASCDGMNVRLLLAMAAGLVIGSAGAAVFQDSLPPPPGTAEAKADALKGELSRAKTMIARLEAQVPKTEPSTTDKARSGVAEILDDIKRGRPVDANAVFNHTKPVLRDLSPVFNLMRRREQLREFDRISSHMAEAYQLNEAQRNALKNWLGERATQDAERFNAVAFADNTTLEDLAKLQRYQRPNQALDEFMDRTLTGDTLQRYDGDRLRER